MRAIFSSGVFVEGWALYWEMRLWDLGFPKTAEDRVGFLFRVFQNDAQVRLVAVLDQIVGGRCVVN